MNSPLPVRLAWILAATLAAPQAARTQPPDTLRLTAKVRDFREIPNATKPPSIPGTHPDFNAFGNCGGKNYVHTRIDTTAASDSVNFPDDNRTPRLLPYLNSGNVRTDCFTSFERFGEWYDDKDTSINRPFLHDLVFTRTPAGMYEYRNRTFFPLNDDSLRLGRTRNLEGNRLATFGHLNACCKQNNYGFTTEFHARFTYHASEDTSRQQVFTFSGDDDVWIFINDTLVVDLGGLHTADAKTIRLDPATAAKLRLEHGKTYLLDFFLAERSIFESNCIITTSLVLETRDPVKPSTVKKSYIRDADGDGRGTRSTSSFPPGRARFPIGSRPNGTGLPRRCRPRSCPS